VIIVREEKIARVRGSICSALGWAEEVVVVGIGKGSGAETSDEVEEVTCRTRIRMGGETAGV